MANSGAVQVKLELGHRAQVRKKPTLEGFTHDWIVFVRGPEHSNIQHFVEKVVFHLHESFPKPKRVCKDPPYKVEESGYAGFILPIEVYFRNKEEPKKVRFDYDLFLHLEGHPPVNHLRCEKLTFNNPTEEFRKKLLKAGGQRDPHKRSSEDSKVMVMQEGSTSLFGQHMKLPTLPTSTLTSPGLADSKKSKSFHGAKNQPLRDINPKMGFKEPKSLSKERRSDGPCLGKRPPATTNGEDHHHHHVTKKRKDLAGRQTLALDSQHSDKRQWKDRSRTGNSRVDAGDKGDQRKGYSLPPFKEPVDPIDSDAEDVAKSDSVIPDLNSEDDEDESEEEDDVGDSDFDRPAHTHMQATHATHTHTVHAHAPHHQRRSVHRVSLSDGSESESSSSPLPASRGEAPPFMKNTNSQILEVKSPSRHSKQDKNKNLDCDKILEVKSPSRHSKQDKNKNLDCDKIVNLIEETGHFHITNTTFDFDLCSLDRSTVRKLQSYLDASGLS
ncbi:hypothetical protein CRUP_029612 [Coryphaenoides rupestris]|nr:hypothetical protein CRUP_029612 [Coryphaenoides rupestris]